MSLLDKAIAAKTRKDNKYSMRDPLFYSKEEQELAWAWVQGEISIGQVRKVMGIPLGYGQYMFLLGALRSAIRSRRIKR